MQVDNCTRCSALCGVRSRIVNGFGKDHAPILFVGQNPGQSEDKEGIPFFGRSGQLLRKLCDAAHISPNEMYRTNAVRCLSPGNRAPKTEEIKNCRDYLIQEIREVNPSVIVTLGEIPFRSLIGMAGKSVDADELEAVNQAKLMAEYDIKLEEWRLTPAKERKALGITRPLKPRFTKTRVKEDRVALRDVAGHTFIQSETGIPVIPTYHPAFLMRGQWHMASVVITHLEKARRIADGEQAAGQLGTYYTVESIEELNALKDYLIDPASGDTIWFDTETTGLSWQEDELLCISFSAGEGEGYVVPILHNPGDGVPDLYPPWENHVQELVNALYAIFGSSKDKGGHNCFTPDTKVLTEDLRWVPIDMIGVGTRLVGFDEETSAGGRRYRPSVVERVESREAEVFKLTMLDGSVLKVTKDHPLLASGFGHLTRWVTVDKMRTQGYGYPQLSKVLEPWETNDSYHAGWVSGFLDADGTLSQQPQIMVGQAEANSDLVDRFVKAMQHLGMDSIRRSPRIVSGYTPTTFTDVATRGAWKDVTALVGRIRPTKLLKQWARWLGKGEWCLRPKHTKIVSIESLGIQPVVNIQTTSRTFIAEGYAVHNCLFDLRMLERSKSDSYINAATAFGIKVNGKIKDTELLHHSLAESIPHNMTSVLAVETDMPFYEDSVKSMKKQMVKVPNDKLWAYSAADADGLPRMWNSMRPRAEAEGVDWVLDNVTAPMISVCRDIERRGFPIDLDYFTRLNRFYEDQIGYAEAAVWKAAPHKAPGWKYNYAPALREVLFKDLNLSVSGRKTKSGRGCEDCKDGVCFTHDQTGKDALEDMILAGETHPILPAIMTVKNLTKRHSTYLAGGQGGLLRYIKNDGRIHPSMKISRAETGRLASELPNAQNIPSYSHIHPEGTACSDSKCHAFYKQTYGINTENAFHDLVTAPKGRAILNIDWSQLEIWVLAYRIHKDLGDRTLLDVLESGVDIHLWMARSMYPELEPGDPDNVWRKNHPDLRRRAKTANFGIGYGLTDVGFVNREHCTLEEAQDTIKRFKDIVPVDDYFKLIRRQLLQDGYVEDEFGRRRHINYLDALKSMGEHMEIEAAIREGINMPIQSGGSNLHSLASFATCFNQGIRDLDCGIILSVHDSLTFELPWPDNDYVHAVAWMIRDLWQKVAWETIKADGTPLHWRVPMECEWGPNWGSPTMKLDAQGNLTSL